MPKVVDIEGNIPKNCIHYAKVMEGGLDYVCFLWHEEWLHSLRYVDGEWLWLRLFSGMGKYIHELYSGGDYATVIYDTMQLINKDDSYEFMVFDKYDCFDIVTWIASKAMICKEIKEKRHEEFVSLMAKEQARYDKEQRLRRDEAKTKGWVLCEECQKYSTQANTMVRGHLVPSCHTTILNKEHKCPLYERLNA